MLAPFLFSDPPCGRAPSRQAAESPLLLVFGDVEPELHQEPAAVGQLPLELPDIVVGLLPLLLGGKVLDALDQHAAVPGAVEQGPVAGGREACSRTATSTDGAARLPSVRRSNGL